MATDTKLAGLLLRYQELQVAGQVPSAEELCRDCPELLDDLKRQIDSLKAFDTVSTPGQPGERETRQAAPRLAGTLQPGMLAAQPTRDSNQSSPAPHMAGTAGLDIRPGSEPVPGYQLVARLGRGTFGEVWKAMAPGGFPVALKIVPLQERANATELNALEIIKSIRHPNLVTAFGAWQREGFLMVAMELADRTLWNRFQEAADQGLPGIPGDELLEYIREAAKGIDYLNQPHHTLAGKQHVSIQHRDIKPQNILLVGNSVKVADFGLVRLLERSLTSHTGSMTPAYAAPEFLRGQTSNQSDQYCLAVTYCELRGGRLPFSGTLAEVMHGHLMSAPDLSMLPEPERGPVMRALAKEPGERWPSCRAFVEALAQGMSGGGSPMPRQKPRTSRRLVLGAVCLLVALIVLLVPSLIPPPSEPNPPGPRDLRPKQAGTNDTASGQNARKGETLDKIAVPEPAIDRPDTQSGEPVPNADRIVISPQTENAKPLTASQIDPSAIVVQPRDEPKPPAGQTQSINTADNASITPAVVAPPAPTPPETPKPTPETPPVVEPPRIGELRRFEKHVGPVRTVAISPSGRRALSAGDDRTIWLWDVETGEGLHPFAGHTAAVQCVAFSHDGRLAISGGEDKSVRLWDVENLAPLGQLNGHTEAVYSVAFSSDGGQAISGGQDTTVRVWNIPDRKERSRFNLPSNESVWSLALSRDNAHVLTASDSNYVRLWDVERGMEEHRFEGHQDVVWCVAFSADGKRALSGGGRGDRQQDYVVRLWDVERKKLLQELKGHADAVGSVAFSHDDRWAISGSADKTVRLWNLETGEELHRFRDHADIVHCVAGSRDGRHALSASADGTVRVWGLPQ